MTDRSHWYIGYCCREWILSAYSLGKGRCGLCGENPKYLREFVEDDKETPA